MGLFNLKGGLCFCNIGYQLLSTQVCQVICGDGRVITEQCDDGNVVDGDGCSSNCLA